MEPLKSSRIFIKNLPSTLTLDDFRKHFSYQLPLTDAKLIPRRRIGYVGYKTPEDAAKAIKLFNKSFMGMARLNVELAKPAAEVVGPLERRKLDGDRIEKAQNYIEDRLENKQDLEISKEKRKREDQSGRRESKLQEYLQVMRPPSKFKTWQNQDQDTLVGRHIPEVMPQEFAFKERDSEEEYEIVPKKKRKTGRQLKMDGPKLPSPPDTPIEEGHGSQDSVIEAAKSTERLEDAPNPTSDADWLRSRTSRLLGLDDDNHTLDVDTEGNERLTSPAGEASQISSHESLRDTAAGDQLKGKREGADATAIEDTLQETKNLGNGRLFLRNLTYTATEEDLQAYFEDHGYGELEEVSFFQPVKQKYVLSMMNILIGTSYALQMMSLGRVF